MKLAIFTAAVIIIVLAFRRSRKRERDKFFWEQWETASDRENFAPDAPGACRGCAASTRSRAASVESAALRVITGN